MSERARFTIDAAGTSLAAERWRGDGPLLVMLHSGVTDRRCWHEVGERLSGVCDLVAYDRRGYGETPLGDGTFSDLEDLGSVLDALGNRPAWLVGNSMGGALALDAALRFPGSVLGLVLIGNAVSGWPESLFRAMDEATLALEQRYERAERQHDVEEMQRVAAWLWLDGPNEPEGRVSGAPRALLHDMIAAITRRDEGGGGKAGVPEAWSLLEQIEAPAVIACGEFDTLLLEPLQELAGRMPRAVFHLLPGTTHLPMLDQPGAIAQLIATTVARPAHAG